MRKAEFASVSSHLGSYGVSAMCRALGVTRQGYYQWALRPTSVHDLRDPEPARLVGDEHEAGMGTCGAPKILARPEAAGVPASRKRVMRIMREHGWRGVTRACAKWSSGERRGLQGRLPR